jgi:hypothetical protein
MIDARIDLLRSRIERYRGYLRDGLNSALAAYYRDQIAHDEAALAKIMLKVRPNLGAMSSPLPASRVSAN